jgi:hypothetical protein
MVYSVSNVMMTMAMMMLEVEAEAVVAVVVRAATMMMASYLVLHVCDGAFCISDVFDMSLIACG